MSTFNEAVLDVANDIRESAPVISIAVGVITLVASGIVAAVSTRKIDDILDEHQFELATIKDMKETGEITEKEASKQTGMRYMHTFGRMILNYAPAVTLGVIGTSLIGLGYSWEHQRLVDTKDQLAVMTATASGLAADLNAYRMRARERFGEEVDNELMYGYSKTKEEVTEVNEKGKEKKVKKEVTHIGDVGNPGYGVYAKWFNKDSCNGWENDAEMNLYYIQSVEDVLNRKLNVEGVLCVNDVYKELEMKDEFGQPLKTKAGQVMGWINDPAKIHQIVLGIHEPVNADFLNKRTTDCLICPIPEGNVWELLND